MSHNPNKEKQSGCTYIASQVRAFTIAVVHATSGGVPVVAIIVTRALAVKLAIAVGDVTLEGLQERLDWEMEVHTRK